ncbi:hypothetical protein CesoFtcFv8_024994 [Champsocephalus esox]|uniref:Uncharacterized protein n=2 Tax=Champsocephalus esox TaxID=159716 RepID=A0AAN8GG90_9TELE|nr:hypothetical protein CesoFtcFv8_024994 [Champsocephalus esox]
MPLMTRAATGLISEQMRGVVAASGTCGHLFRQGVNNKSGSADRLSSDDTRLPLYDLQSQRVARGQITAADCFLYPQPLPVYGRLTERGDTARCHTHGTQSDNISEDTQQQRGRASSGFPPKPACMGKLIRASPCE